MFPCYEYKHVISIFISSIQKKHPSNSATESATDVSYSICIYMYIYQIIHIPYSICQIPDSIHIFIHIHSYSRFPMEFPMERMVSSPWRLQFLHELLRLLRLQATLVRLGLETGGMGMEALW